MPDGTFYDRELETMPWPKIQAMTFERTRHQLERIYATSAWYRRRFDEAGVRPGDIRHPEDLARVPFTEKDDERTSQEESPPFGGHLCVPEHEVVRVHASSGTTGRPTFFAFTKEDLRTWDTIMGRTFYTTGMRPGDRYGVLGNLSMFSGGIPAVTAAAAIGALGVPIGATAGTERTLELVKLLGVNVMGATPSFAVHLGEVVKQVTGESARSLGLRYLMVGGEPGGQIPALRSQIAEAWGCPVRDLMGIGEFAGGCWAESDDEAGLHFCGLGEIHLELIDSETGEAKPWEDGATGEIVYTAAQREATPLIRFRSHDHVVVRLDPVRSGRTAPRVVPLGRTDDMLLVRGINVFPSAVRDVVASFAPRTTGHVRLVLERPGPLVEPPLPIEVEVANDLPVEHRDQLVTEIVTSIRQRLHFNPEIRLVGEGELPRTTLKTQYLRKVYEERA
jgi:phenylacetate-CoA ligase